MNDNLLCAKSDRLMGDIHRFNSGVNTYTKILKEYMKNGCSNVTNNEKGIKFKLNTEDYIDSVNSDIDITCSKLRNNLIDYGDVINTASKEYATNIKHDIFPYIDNSQTLLNNYNQLVNNRIKLDEDMQKILAIDNTQLYEKQNILDSAVFTTLLWTVLATSALYYAFTKI